MEFLRMLAEIRTPLFDGIFQLITYLGQEIPILLVICAIYWCLNKSLAYRIAISFFTSGLVLQNLKITFRVERPWILDPDFQPVESAVSGATGYSFPSGHTQSASSFWGTIASHSKKNRNRILCCVIFLLVGFSRMYLGCHTPKDIVGGLCIGLLSVWFGGFLMKRLRDTPGENLLISVILALASVFTAFYALSLQGDGVISLANANDCVKASGAGIGFAVGWYVERVYLRFRQDLNTRGRVKRYLLGVVLMLVLKVLLKALLGDSLPMEMLQYFILVVYIIALYPALFSRLFPGKL